MKRIVLFLSLLLLSFSSIQAVAPGETGFEYNPLPSGSSLNYWYANMTGYYHPDTHMLDAWTVDYVKSIVISAQEFPAFCPHFFGAQSAWGSYTHDAGTSDTFPTIMGPGQAVLMTYPAVSSNGISYWGEVGGLGVNVNMIPEAIVTKNPVAGEVIEEHSKIYSDCEGQTVMYPAYHWRYQTTAITGDVVRTDLIEYNSEVSAGACNWVYTYFFQKDVGIINLLWGCWDQSNNHVTGWAIGILQ